jgi:hypothetical protein
MNRLSLILVAWAILIAASVAGVAFRIRIVREDREAVTALRLSLAAVAPGACLLAEYLVREIQGVPILPLTFVTLWPATVGVLLGSIALIVSYVGFPPARTTIAMDFVRAMHLSAWAMSFWAVASAFVSS